MQVAVFAAMAAAAMAATAALQSTSPGIFDRFVGDLDPLGAVAVCGIAGLGLLAALSRRDRFVIFDRRNLRHLPMVLAGTLPFAVAAIVLDVLVRFPIDTHVALPDALLFYSAIAFVVEVAFHLLPLTIVLQLWKRSEPAGTRIWVAFAIVAALEPAYQAAFMAADASYPLWSLVYLCGYLAAFNLLQLWIFRRYDFVSMIAFRLGYYALWHVAWGHVRLTVLV